MDVSPSNFDLHAVVRDMRKLSNKATQQERELKLFTLVAGIRPVKNPLFLVEAFSGNFLLLSFLRVRLISFFHSRHTFDDCDKSI